jgi:predicted transcriptional regulator
MPRKINPNHAKTLSFLTTTMGNYTLKVAEHLDVDAKEALKSLQYLKRKGFIFNCEVNDGKNRKGGKYASAFWMPNAEVRTLTEAECQRALEIAQGTKDSGHDVLVDHFGAC